MIIFKQCSSCVVLKPSSEFYSKRKECKSCHNAKTMQNYWANYSRIRNQQNRYIKYNADNVNLANTKWRLKHKKYFSTYKRNRYKRNRYNSDVQFKLSSLLRARLNRALSVNQKVGSAVYQLGCSIDKLKIYLQLKFHRNPRGQHEYMTWNNHGKWHIDHIKPLSSFDLTDLEQVKRACHYTNLQPMWAKDNITKGDKDVGN